MKSELWLRDAGACTVTCGQNSGSWIRSFSVNGELHPDTTIK